MKHLNGQETGTTSDAGSLPQNAKQSESQQPESQIEKKRRGKKNTIRMPGGVKPGKMVSNWQGGRLR